MNPDRLVIAACDIIWSDDSVLLTVKSFQEPSGYICHSGVDLPRVKFTVFDGQLLICPGYIKGRVSGPHLPPSHTEGRSEARHDRGRREPGQPDSGPRPGSRQQLADWGASLQC